jgi:hypothetical protein
MAMTMEWQRTFGWLGELIAGKDPRRLVRPELGNIVLVLRQPSGATERATLRLGRERVELVPGAVTSPSEPELMIRGAAADWQAYFDTRDPQYAGALDFYGHAPLLSTLSTLIAQNRSVWAVQFSTTDQGDHEP